MLLELKNVKKYFSVKSSSFGFGKTRVRAVDGIDLKIEKGENISLVGESGCGKTTLARLIAKLYPLTAGEIYFNNFNVTKFSEKKFRQCRKNIQMVFQDPNSSLDPRFRIRSILLEGFTLDDGKYKNLSNKELRIHELLDAVGISGDILDRYPHEFSGGEKQRIALARALLLNPKLLILDEAVSSLDVIIQKQTLDLLIDIQKKFEVTYLFITHNLKVARKISHKIAVMYRGKVVELAKTEEIFSNPLHPYTKELLTAAIEYKTPDTKTEFEISQESKLVDQGGGHFVLH